MSRIVITQVDDDQRPGFSSRHPALSYVFGDMVRGFFVVGCISIDLLAPLQIHLSVPSLDAFLLPPTIAGVVALAYVEFRLYRRWWPASRRRRVLGVVERGDP